MGTLTPRIIELASALSKHGAKIAAGAAAGAVLGVSAYTAHHLKKQKKWRESAGPKDYLQIGHDLVVDRHGAMLPHDHPHVKRGTVHQLSALTPGMIFFARTRNTDGEFSPAAAGTADPSAMLKTYGTAPGMGGGQKATIAVTGLAASASLGDRGAALIRSLRKRK